MPSRLFSLFRRPGRRKRRAGEMSRLKGIYLDKIVPLLRDKFAYPNIHQVPKLEKIVVKFGIGDAAQNAKGLDAAVNDLVLITGQRPVKSRSKNSLTTFKIRDSQPLGIALTLRGNSWSALHYGDADAYADVVKLALGENTSLIPLKLP